MDNQMVYNGVMTFREWIQTKYSQWSDNGKKSESQYALYLGVSQATLNAWLNGRRGAPTTPAIINRLIELYGDGEDVYAVLGMTDSLGGLPPALWSCYAIRPICRMYRAIWGMMT